jgi:hypothetical protein
MNLKENPTVIDPSDLLAGKDTTVQHTIHEVKVADSL